MSRDQKHIILNNQNIGIHRLGILNIGIWNIGIWMIGIWMIGIWELGIWELGSFNIGISISEPKILYLSLRYLKTQVLLTHSSHYFQLFPVVFVQIA